MVTVTTTATAMVQERTIEAKETSMKSIALMSQLCYLSLGVPVKTMYWLFIGSLFALYWLSIGLLPAIASLTCTYHT